MRRSKGALFDHVGDKHQARRMTRRIIDFHRNLPIVSWSALKFDLTIEAVTVKKAVKKMGNKLECRLEG
jgi:hypothetical protein